MGLDEKVICFHSGLCVRRNSCNTHAGGGGLEQCPMRYARDVRPARAEVLIASRKTPEASHDLTELPSDVGKQLVSARSGTDEIKKSFQFEF